MCEGSRGVPASHGSSSGSGPGPSSSGTAPAAFCVSASSWPSPPPPSASPPPGPSPTRPAAVACSASWAAPSSWAVSRHLPPLHHPPRCWKTRSCRLLRGTSAFCGSRSGCRRWKSPRTRSCPGNPARCRPPGSSGSRTGIRRKTRTRRTLRHCRPVWRRAGRSVASWMRPPWFCASTRTFSACTNSPCLDAGLEARDMNRETEREERTEWDRSVGAASCLLSPARHSHNS